jgi:hypothetical protein
MSVPFLRLFRARWNFPRKRPISKTKPGSRVRIAGEWHVLVRKEEVPHVRCEFDEFVTDLPADSKWWTR